MSRTRLGRRWSSGAYSKYRDRVRGTNVTLTSPRSAILAIGSGRSSRSKKRRRNWADSHSMFHCPTAPTISRSKVWGIASATYSGGAGSSGRTTPPNRNAADMFFRQGNSSGAASTSGRNTSSRRHASTSAAVGSRSSLTSSSSIGRFVR